MTINVGARFRNCLQRLYQKRNFATVCVTVKVSVRAKVKNRLLSYARKHTFATFTQIAKYIGTHVGVKWATKWAPTGLTHWGPALCEPGQMILPNWAAQSISGQPNWGPFSIQLKCPTTNWAAYF